MSWDPAWEQVFSSRDWGKYPPEELIRFIARNFYSAPDRKSIRLLELGCGTGANIWFMAREGFDTCGIDGAPSAIAKAERHLREDDLVADLKVGDVVALGEHYAPASFDAVVDVCCLQHNALNEIRIALAATRLVLKPGGLFFGIMLADDSACRRSGREVEPGSFVDITEGPLSGKGLVHLFTLEEIRRLFAPFTQVQIESMSRTMNEMRDIHKQWVVQGMAPA